MKSHSNPIKQEMAPAVGRTIPHDSSWGHVTGTAVFMDDVTMMANELYVGYVGSPVAHGKLISVDLSEAKRIPGIIGLYTHTDIGGSNTFGPIIEDEHFMVETECTYIGDPIVVIAAETQEAIVKAKKAIKLEIEALTPILTIDEAIAADEFIGPMRRFGRGDAGTALDYAKNVIMGTFVNGGQEHFYLESQAAIAYPGEENQLNIHSSTQNPTEVQSVIAEVLGLGDHQVICQCKRMGGGFGGKETQATIPALMVGLVALKTKRPARLIVTKDDDMKFTGKRHAYQTHYQVGFDDNGLITALKILFYSNGGCAADLSTSVLDRSMFHADNAYFLSDVEISGRVCRTNLPSNTAFRGFGGPQAIAAIENILEEIALYLGQDAYDVRVRNIYGLEDRNITPYGQTVTNNFLAQIFPQLAKQSNYRERLAAVREFNKTSRTHLKGISMTPIKFGISFTTKFLNQGNALVNIYKDGTIQVSTGGTEMGQGLNTKIKQLVADEFAIPPEWVMIMTTSTEKNNNTSPTAASAGTDLNGSAAVLACEKIRERLVTVLGDYFASADSSLPPDPTQIVFDSGHVYDKRNAKHCISFRDLIGLAFHERVSLGERAHYATPGLDFDREKGVGNPFFYYTTGCAVSEVLIDKFTGDLSVERSDILMDIGVSINPGIDRGQIIGGFIQGMGWCTTEELKYAEDGRLLSYSPTTYKIPAITDLPKVFNVDFFDNKTNTKNVRSSKAVGEPPLMLGTSVWTAVKHALSFAHPNTIPNLTLPATNEQILLCLQSQKHDDNTVVPEEDQAILDAEHIATSPQKEGSSTALLVTT